VKESRPKGKLLVKEEWGIRTKLPLLQQRSRKEEEADRGVAKAKFRFEVCPPSIYKQHVKSEASSCLDLSMEMVANVLFQPHHFHSVLGAPEVGSPLDAVLGERLTQQIHYHAKGEPLSPFSFMKIPQGLPP